jgi:hypothetical protein
LRIMYLRLVSCAAYERLLHGRKVEWERGDVQSVDDSRDVTEDREQDVDEQIGAAAALEEDAEGREEDGEDDLADVAAWCVSREFSVMFAFNSSLGSSRRAGAGAEAPEEESYLAVKAMMSSVL